MCQLAEHTGHTSVSLHSSPVDQLAEHSCSHFFYSPVIIRGSAGRAQLVTLLLLSTHHPWISWQSTAGHTSVTLHSSPVDQLAEHSWSHFCYSPLITRGSAGRTQLVTLLLLSTHHPCVSWQSTLVTLLFLSTHHPWISWQSTAVHTSVTLQSSSVDQLAEHSWSHFCYSPLITRGSAGRAQLVTLLLLSSHQPWISWQSTAGHTSVTLHSSPVDQLAEHSWSHFCFSPLITRGSAGRVQLVTLLLLSTHHPCISWQSTAGHTSVTLHSSPVDQLAEYSWSHFCYSPLITRGSAGRAQLVTLLLLSTHHPWISWQSTAGHTSVTLHSSPVDQLAEHSWSHFCYSPLITRGSAGRTQLVTLLLLSTHHPCVSWQSTLVTLLFLSTHHPWISWQSTAVHTSVTLQSSSVDQLAEHSWSHFCYSPLITRGSAGRAQLVTLLLLSSHHPWISWQSTAGHTSITLHSSPVDQLAEHSWSHFCYSPLITRVSAGRAHWSHFCYSPLITRGSAGRAQLVTPLLLSTHHPWISWQSTAGHTSVTLHSSPVCQLAEHTGDTSVTLHSSPVDQLAEHSWSHFCYSPLITRGSAGRVQLVTPRLLSTHHPWISWQSTAGHTSITSTHHPWISWQNTAGHTSVTLHSSPVCQLAEHTGHTSVSLHSSPVDQLAEHSWSHFCYSPLITRGSVGRIQLITTMLLSTHHPWISWQSTACHILLLSTHHPWISWQSTAGQTSVTLHSSPVDQLAEHSWSHFCYSPLITRVSAGGGHWEHFFYYPVIIRGSTGREILISLKQKLLIVIN